MKHESLERQLAREEQQRELGAERYRRNIEGKPTSELTVGQLLVKRAVEPVVQSLDLIVDRALSGKAGRGRPARCLKYLQMLESYPLAYITARLCLDGAANRDRVSKVAMAIATSIQDHYEFEELRVEEKSLANSLQRKAKKWSTAHHRQAIMRLGVKVADVAGLQWTDHDKLALGMKLVETFVAETGLVEAVYVREGKTSTGYRLQVSQKTSDWLDVQHGRLELLEPLHTPMVHPPMPWSNPINGGYITIRNDIVRKMQASFRDDLFSVEMTEVYRALNAIQETPWQVNRFVYDVAAQLWDEGAQVAGLPARDLLPIPNRPDDIPSDLQITDMTADQQERFKAWKIEAAKAHDRNASLISKRIATQSKLSMALDVLDEESIWFPYHLDFRGRAYCTVSSLSPQGDDLSKALLHFAEGKPLGLNGAYWLHVHIANLFGVDKVSYDDRVAWTMKHTPELIDSAFNPLDGDRFWLTADSPWCALAACRELAGFRVAGAEYVSHLPIAMDGSCSGLQHFSAMLRDEVGGAAVNLVPMETPADIYTAVAERVESELLKSTEQLAISWRGNVKRKIVKRPCMTYAYSVTSRGMRDQILDEMHKQSSGGEYLAGWENYEAATFLAPIVESAIRATVKQAALAMDWLKAAVKPIVAENIPLTFFTPDGFPVQHRYIKTNGKKFDVWFGGMRMQIQLRVDTVKQDVRKHQSSIAPNFVHAMDATHLRMVVNRMVSAGYMSFAMIHDSFGVHACDIDELNYAIREQFIELYATDRLAEFRGRVLEVDPEAELEDTPSYGNLNLEDVHNADFFFS